MNVSEMRPRRKGREGSFPPSFINTSHSNCGSAQHSTTLPLSPSLNDSSFLKQRYEAVTKVGAGSYANVYLCKDTQAGNAEVAVKVFVEANTHPQVLKSALREAELLRKHKHPNIVEMHQSFRSDSGRVYLVMEYIPNVLSKVIREKSGLPSWQIRQIAFQLLGVVNYLHKKQVIHRDLKPGNLMLTDAGTLKVIDFGLARQGRPQTNNLTPYTMTRWFRAPEVLLAAPYSYGVDIWSIGCILAEMVTGTSLFPGKSHINQLELIIKCFGTLPPRFQSICNNIAAEGKMTLPDGPFGGLRGKLPDVPDDLFEIISSCLQIDPLRRPTAETLLKLPYFDLIARSEKQLPPALRSLKDSSRTMFAAWDSNSPSGSPEVLTESCQADSGKMTNAPGLQGSFLELSPVTQAVNTNRTWVGQQPRSVKPTRFESKTQSKGETAVDASELDRLNRAAVAAGARKAAAEFANSLGAPIAASSFMALGQTGPRALRMQVLESATSFRGQMSLDLPQAVCSSPQANSLQARASLAPNAMSNSFNDRMTPNVSQMSRFNGVRKHGPSLDFQSPGQALESPLIRVRQAIIKTSLDIDPSSSSKKYMAAGPTYPEAEGGSWKERRAQALSSQKAEGAKKHSLDSKQTIIVRPPSSLASRGCRSFCGKEAFQLPRLHPSDGQSGNELLYRASDGQPVTYNSTTTSDSTTAVAAEGSYSPSSNTIQESMKSGARLLSWKGLTNFFNRRLASKNCLKNGSSESSGNLPPNRKSVIRA